MPVALVLGVSPLLFAGHPLTVRAAGAFVVNTTADGHDLIPGDSLCSTGAANNVCTLRAAIEEANFLGLSSTITFSVNGVFALNLGELHVTGSPAQSLTITGNGTSNTIIDGSSASRVVNVDSGAAVNMSGVTIQHGKVSGDGGGIRNAGTLNLSNSGVASNAVDGVGGGGLSNLGTATLTNVNVDANTATRSRGAPDGGGINNQGSLTYTNGTVSNNTANKSSDGGGIAIDGGTVSLMNLDIHDNTASSGGGISDDSFGGSSVVNVTLRNNHAGAGTLTAASAFGGGLVDFAGGGVDSLINVTVDGNTANGPGGGVAIGTSTRLSIVNSTIAGNTAGTSGGGLYVEGQQANATVKYSILSANGPNNCATARGGSISSGGQNVESGNSCGLVAPADKPNTDPLLVPLASNPGPNPFVPLTHALKPNSPAVDFMPAGSCPPPATDERGVPRPQGAACDSGAFELEMTAPLPNAPEFPVPAGGVAMALLVAGAIGALRRRRATSGSVSP